MDLLTAAKEQTAINEEKRWKAKEKNEKSTIRKESETRTSK